MEKIHELVKVLKYRLEDMHDCPQDPIHHAEGNVLLHTLMVAREIFRSDYWKKCSEADKEILMLTALLHDIDKPTTFEKHPDGSITHKGHSRKGAKTARMFMGMVGYDYSVIVQVHWLIVYHGVPFWAIERDTCDLDIITASMDCRLDLLYEFAKADLKGRICSDYDDCLLRIELFKERAIELGCFDKPFEFSNIRDKWAFFHKDSSYPHKGLLPETEDGGFKVIMVCGISASGKNSYISSNKEYAGMPVVEMDAIREAMGARHGSNSEQGRVRQEAKSKIREYASKGTPFIINNTCITRQMRQDFIGQVMDMVDTKPFVEIVFLLKDLEDITKHNRNRENSIPNYSILKQYANMELPSSTEAHIVRYLNTTSNIYLR